MIALRRHPFTRTLAGLLIAALTAAMAPQEAWASRAVEPPPVTIHADGIGSVRTLTDESAAVTDTYAYTAFGELLSHTGTDPQPYAFAGEPYDFNARFYYNRARWLDPAVGRFISSDSFDGIAEDPTSLHKYLYVAGHPLDATDPTGHENLPTQLASLAGRVALALSSLGAAIHQAFARGGGAALGPLWRAVGTASERAFYQTVLYYQRIQPLLSIDGNFRLVNGSRIDGYVSMGTRVAFMEAKSSVPSRVGPALTRVVGQMQGSLAQAREGHRIVLWSFHRAGPSQMELVRRSVGPGGEKIEFINGVEGLWNWLIQVFGPA